MLIKRLYDTRLAQASYLVGCQSCGEALVVDPNRDVDQYVAAAKAEGLRITYVTETHIHADFVSGTRELAARTKAVPVLSDEGGADWSYKWAKEAGARLVKDGDSFMAGNVKVEVLHTPGHTPEHLSFRITDTKATDRPMGVFTGDFVFVGDVGRPDLLEKAAGVVGTMDAAAHALFRSLQRFKENPDYLQIWPGHGAGSACGKALGAVPSSTLGYERFANWGLATAREADFVRMVLDGQPEPPAYFAVMKRVNRDGPRLIGSRERPARIGADALPALAARATIVDTRRTADFAKSHVRGTLNVPFGNSFPTYAGSVLPYDRPLALIVPEALLDDALRSLSSVGLDDVAGWLAPDALEGAGPMESTTQVTARDVALRLAAGGVTVVDVRGRSEWDAGHLPGARHIPLGMVASFAAELGKAGPLVMQCESGSRSAIAASILLARGVTDVANLTGGFGAWKEAGLPVDAEAAMAAGAR
ncbi:MAG: rhodanese-like domain-containing protein [Gemmatimonadales bacterium]